MRSPWRDPLSTFCDAATSAVGWLLVMFLTSLSGLWLGLWIGLGELPSIDWIVCGAALVLAAPAFFPHLVILYGVTFLLWYLPHRFESFQSPGIQLGAAVANLVAWLACWAIVGLASAQARW